MIATEAYSNCLGDVADCGPARLNGELVGVGEAGSATHSLLVALIAHTRVQGKQILPFLAAGVQDEPVA